MANDIKLEKGIPVPTRVRYPWKTMKVGESFVMEYSSARSNVYHLAKLQGVKVAVHTLGDGRARVWRVA
jgi:hypothetical protein